MRCWRSNGERGSNDGVQRPAARKRRSPLADRKARGVTQANAFELRRPFLIHSLVVVAAWLTYLFDREDLVWRLIRSHAQARLLEHAGFGCAAAAIGAGILLGAWRADRDHVSEGWAPRSTRLRCVGEILNGIGIASLVPVAGFVLLVAGETVRSGRYARLKMQVARERGGAPFPSLPGSSWKWLVVSQAGVWCGFVSMSVFSMVLVDRVADYLFAGTALVWVVTRSMLPSDHVAIVP